MVQALLQFHILQTWFLTGRLSVCKGELSFPWNRLQIIIEIQTGEKITNKPEVNSRSCQQFLDFAFLLVDGKAVERPKRHKQTGVQEEIIEDWEDSCTDPSFHSTS